MEKDIQIGSICIFTHNSSGIVKSFTLGGIMPMLKNYGSYEDVYNLLEKGTRCMHSKKEHQLSSYTVLIYSKQVAGQVENVLKPGISFTSPLH